MAYLCPLRGVRHSLWSVLALGAGLACGAQAGSLEKAPPRWEAWTGGEAVRDVWSLYSGATLAPFGSVQEDGLRLRAVLGRSYGSNGTVQFGDALVGYHGQLGPLTLKLFGGLAFTEERRLHQDVLFAIGGKGLLEAWWDITDQVWTSADIGFTGPRRNPDTGVADGVDYAGRLRLGWRLDQRLSAGLETGAGGLLVPAMEPESVRAGGFVRYEWRSGVLSISGGVVGAGPGGGRDSADGPFAIVSVLTRF